MMRNEEFSAAKFHDDGLIECYNKLAMPRACWLCERLKAEVCEPKGVVPIDREKEAMAAGSSSTLQD